MEWVAPRQVDREVLLAREDLVRHLGRHSLYLLFLLLLHPVPLGHQVLEALELVQGNLNQEFQQHQILQHRLWDPGRLFLQLGPFR